MVTMLVKPERGGRGCSGGYGCVGYVELVVVHAVHERRDLSVGERQLRNLITDRLGHGAAEGPHAGVVCHFQAEPVSLAGTQASLEYIELLGGEHATASPPRQPRRRSYVAPLHQPPDPSQPLDTRRYEGPTRLTAVAQLLFQGAIEPSIRSRHHRPSQDHQPAELTTRAVEFALPVVEFTAFSVEFTWSLARRSVEFTLPIVEFTLAQ